MTSRPRCRQCGHPLQSYQCSPKWCSRTRLWSEDDRRKLKRKRMTRISQADADRRHAECVRMSRMNAARYDARAREEAARGNHAEADRLRQNARDSRREADMQERCGAGRV